MSLDSVRAEISLVDAEIIRLIARRQQLAAEIAQIKIAGGLPIHDGERASGVLDSAASLAAGHRIDPVAVRKIFGILIAMSEERQRECAGEGKRP